MWTSYVDIHAGLPIKLEADEAAIAIEVILKNLVEECHQMMNLKHDMKIVESKAIQCVNVIARNQKKLVKRIARPAGPVAVLSQTTTV